MLWLPPAPPLRRSGAFRMVPMIGEACGAFVWRPVEEGGAALGQASWEPSGGRRHGVSLTVLRHLELSSRGSCPLAGSRGACRLPAPSMHRCSAVAQLLLGPALAALDRRRHHGGVRASRWACALPPPARCPRGTLSREEESADCCVLEHSVFFLHWNSLL